MIIGNHIKFSCLNCSKSGHRSNTCVHTEGLTDSADPKHAGRIVVTIGDQGRDDGDTRVFKSSHPDLRLRLMRCDISESKNPRCETTGDFAFKCSAKCRSRLHKQGPINNVFVEKEKIQVISITLGVGFSFPNGVFTGGQGDYFSALRYLLPTSAHWLGAFGLSYHNYFHTHSLGQSQVTTIINSLGKCSKYLFDGEHQISKASPYYSTNFSINPLLDGRLPKPNVKAQRVLNRIISYSESLNRGGICQEERVNGVQELKAFKRNSTKYIRDLILMGNIESSQQPRSNGRSVSLENNTTVPDTISSEPKARELTPAELLEVHIESVSAKSQPLQSVSSIVYTSPNEIRKDSPVEQNTSYKPAACRTNDTSERPLRNFTYSSACQQISRQNQSYLQQNDLCQPVMETQTPKTFQQSSGQNFRDVNQHLLPSNLELQDFQLSDENEDQLRSQTQWFEQQVPRVQSFLGRLPIEEPKAKHEQLFVDDFLAQIDRLEAGGQTKHTDPQHIYQSKEFLASDQPQMNDIDWIFDNAFQVKTSDQDIFVEQGDNHWSNWVSIDQY